MNTVHDKQGYINAMQSELHRLQKAAEDLESRLGDGQSMRYMGDQLLLSRCDASTKLEMLLGAEDEHWEDLKVMVDSAMNCLRSTVNRVAATISDDIMACAG